MTSTRWTAGLIALGLSLAACGASATSDDSSAPAAPVTDAAPAPATEQPVTEQPAAEGASDSGNDTPSPAAAAVPSALQFTAPLVGGDELNAAELAGKPTAFWFWAPT